MSEDYVILGGGPTGSTIGTYLARGGASVTIVDQAEIPDGVVGESLIPMAADVIADLGLDMSGFMVKRGAVITRGEEEVRFAFDQALRASPPHAWQVPRADFDARLRSLARDAGCRFHYGRALGVELPGVVHTDAGDLRCGTFIDAGGRSQFLARRLGIRTVHPVLRNAAQVAWHRGVRALGVEEEGDIAICTFEGGWFWLIPFADGTASVGVVTTPDGPRGPDRWARALELCPAARRRLEGAERLEDLRGLADFTTRSERFFGDGWVLAGDAAAFLDPVFSTGVCLGMNGGRRLARALLAGEPLDAYEAYCRRGIDGLEPIVLAFYQADFLPVAFSDPGAQNDTVRRSIISLLAGDVFDDDFSAPRRFARHLPSLARMLTPRAIG